MEYTVNKDFNGRMNVSSVSYSHKLTKDEIKGIRFNEMSVSNDILSTFISSGYSYCPTDRKLDQVKSADYICIDIDGSTMEMNDYVSTLTDTPTIYYTTPSNGDIEKSIKKYGDDKHIYRFRLVYALSTPTKNAEDYEKAFRYITTTNDMSDVDFRRANQYYNGSKDCELHSTDRVYVLPEEYRSVSIAENKVKAPAVKTPIKGKKRDNKSLSIYSELDKEVLSQFLDCQRYEDFLSWCYDTFGESTLKRESLYREDKEDERKLVCDDYYRIPMKYVKWDKVTKTRVYGKWQDGEDRHTKIYITGIILRKLNPDATPDELLREIVSILLSYYDICDPDGRQKFNKKTILQTLDSVMRANLRRELKEIKHSSFKINSSYCDKERMSKRQVLGTLLGEKKNKEKEERYRDIDFFYEPKETIQGKKITINQWKEILEENGVEVSVATLKRFLKENGFSKTHSNKKSIKSKPNIEYHNTIRFACDTFFEEDLDQTVCDMDWVESDRRFKRIIERIRSTEDFKKKWDR